MPELLTNCLIFSIRRLCAGGYLIARKSRFGWWPHFMWAQSVDGIEVENLVPATPLKWDELPWWQKILPVHVALFRGVIRNDDKDVK